jgi:hypothetical protein
LVVAHINVKGFIGILTLHHSGMTISITKSSMAIYNTSSIFGLSLCISSINKISHCSRLFKMLTISEGFDIAYQVTAFIQIFHCLDIIYAIVVLPNQLGQENNICHI